MGIALPLSWAEQRSALGHRIQGSESVRICPELRPAPRPSVASTFRRVLGCRDILLFGVCEAPDFVDLDPNGFHVAHAGVVAGGTSFACVNQQLGDGVLAHAGRVCDRADAHAFAGKVEAVRGCAYRGAAIRSSTASSFWTKTSSAKHRSVINVLPLRPMPPACISSGNGRAMKPCRRAISTAASTSAPDDCCRWPATRPALAWLRQGMPAARLAGVLMTGVEKGAFSGSELKPVSCGGRGPAKKLLNFPPLGWIHLYDRDARGSGRWVRGFR